MFAATIGLITTSLFDTDFVRMAASHNWSVDAIGWLADELLLLLDAMLLLLLFSALWFVLR